MEHFNLAIFPSGIGSFDLVDCSAVRQGSLSHRTESDDLLQDQPCSMSLSTFSAAHFWWLGGIGRESIRSAMCSGAHNRAESSPNGPTLRLGNRCKDDWCAALERPTAVLERPVSHCRGLLLAEFHGLIALNRAQNHRVSTKSEPGQGRLAWLLAGWQSADVIGSSMLRQS